MQSRDGPPVKELRALGRRGTAFHPATKAHPAILVRGLAELAERCRAAGYPPVTDEPLEGFNRFYVSDRFGNRLELLEPR